MRILNVNNMLDPATGGGTAERTFQMSRALARAGLDCTVLTTDVGLTPERVRELGGAEAVVCPTLWRRFFVPQVSCRRIRDLVRRADVIHLMGHWSVLNAIVYFAARAARKPYVVCPAGALPIYGRSGLLKRLYNLVVGRALVRNARACIAITADEIPHFERYGVPRERIHVIPNGIALDELPPPDATSFRVRHRLGEAPIVLFVGRLNPIKGPDLLLEAFANVAQTFPDHLLVFVGPDGGMLAGLQATAARRGLADRVRFVGFLGGAEKYQAYYAASLLAIPSRQEAMSIVVLEAGAAGTPVLITDQCGFAEIARLGAGEVVGASVGGLEQGLARLLGDRAALARMGAALREHVRQKYLWDNLVPVYLALYRQWVVSAPVRAGEAR
jgi:glycosyltransferase involved in cell wall biosynthesis